MKAFIKALAIPVMLILAMPVAGTVFFGKPLAPYLHFPPRPVYQPHAPFSPDLFVLGLTLALAALVLSSTSLFFMGIHPDFLFFLVWIAPFVVIVCPCY